MDFYIDLFKMNDFRLEENFTHIEFFPIDIIDEGRITVTDA